MSDAQKTTENAAQADAPAKVEACRIIRKTDRGDWYASLSVSAFDGENGENDAEGSFTRVVEGTVSVRFGGRGGAIIAATPDEARASLVVASVRKMREVWGKSYKKNDARPGAIPSTVIALAEGSAKTLAQGAYARKLLGSVPASRRVTVAPKALEKTAEKFSK